MDRHHRDAARALDERAAGLSGDNAPLLKVDAQIDGQTSATAVAGSRLRPLRGLKSFGCAARLFTALDAMQLIERGFVTALWAERSHAGGRSYMRARRVAGIVDGLGQRV